MPPPASWADPRHLLHHLHRHVLDGRACQVDALDIILDGTGATSTTGPAAPSTPLLYALLLENPGRHHHRRRPPRRRHQPQDHPPDSNCSPAADPDLDPDVEVDALDGPNGFTAGLL